MKVQRAHITEIIGNSDVETTCVATGQAALRAIKENTYDALILDLGLPDVSGLDVLEEIRQIRPSRLPVLVYTAKDLNTHEAARLKILAESVIIKSPESECPPLG